MRRVFTGLLAAIILAPITGGFAEDGPSVQVETVPLRRQPVASTLTAYGTVTAGEESMAVISFAHAGQITGLNVRAGQKVQTGEPLVTITADPAAQQSYQKAVATLKFAERELERQRTLRAQHLATNAQVASAQQAVDDATVTLGTERKLGNDQPSSVATAPFAGYVAQLMAAPGDRLQANTAIMKLARTDKGLRVSAGLRPEDASRVSPGMQAEVIPVLSSSAQPIEGTVREISGNLNPATKLIDAWIDVPQKANFVPGSMVTIAIILSRHQGWAVPRNAVLHDEMGSYIFQVSSGHAKRVEVKTGIETDQLTEILGPFDPSLAVVTTGNYELAGGMAVREAPSATEH